MFRYNNCGTFGSDKVRVSTEGTVQLIIFIMSVNSDINILTGSVRSVHDCVDEVSLNVYLNLGFPACRTTLFTLAYVSLPAEAIEGKVP